MLVISYGMFTQTSKLFFYETAGVGCMPIFTDPTVASLFLASVYSRMGDLLSGKPELCVVACSHKQHALDMFSNISMFAKDVKLVDLNPLPLTDFHKEKLASCDIRFESYKYEVPEIIELLQREK
jgi:hypothetical protein